MSNSRANSNLDDLDNFDVETTTFESDSHLTPAEIVAIMEEAWLNEKLAPEILPHRIEVVEALLAQISYMEANIETLTSTDFTKNLYQMEVERLRFLVSSYLRIRLQKIEVFVSEILKQETLRSERGEETYLTEKELEFAAGFQKGLKQHLLTNLSFLHVPNIELKPVVPNLNSFVFLKSKRDKKGIIIDEGSDDTKDEIDLTKDSQVLISYKSVAELVKNGDVHLI